MAGVLLPFLKWFIGGSSSKGPKVLNFLVRSPWSTIDVVGQVRGAGNISFFFRIRSLGHNNLFDQIRWKLILNF